MNKLIKIKDKAKAERLASLGFKYAIEDVEGIRFYVFFNSPELEEAIQSNYSDESFLKDSKLRF